MRAWRSAVFLARRNLRSHPARALTLVLALALVLALPIFLRSAVHDLEEAMMRRARATPLVVGPAGDRIDLTLASLRFHPKLSHQMPMSVVQRLRSEDYGSVVPLFLEHSVQEKGEANDPDQAVADPRGCPLETQVVVLLVLRILFNRQVPAQWGRKT